MKKIVKAFWGISLLLIAVIIALYFKIEDRRETVAMLNTAAYYANKTTPKFVDSYTLLEKVTAENMKLVYYFTISERLENYNRDSHKLNVLNSFNSFGCGAPKIKSDLLDKGVKFLYKYYKEDGTIMTEFLFTKEHCIENA